MSHGPLPPPRTFARVACSEPVVQVQFSLKMDFHGQKWIELEDRWSKTSIVVANHAKSALDLLSSS